jgi:hypothetical protein
MDEQDVVDDAFTKEVLTILGAESDRGCLLVAAAWVDEMLAELIQARLVDHEKTMQSLFDEPNAR